MTKADALSRRPDYDKGENDNENVTLIKDQWVQVRGQVHTSRDELLVKIKEAQQRMTEPPQGVTMADGIMVKDGKVYVPDDVRELVMKEYHDSPLSGHPGANKTLATIRRDFFWSKRMYVDIRNYVRGCDRCQRTKPSRQPRMRTLHPHAVPEAPWEEVTVDFIGELPESNGYNAICVVVDRFSKQIHAIPTTTKITAQ